MDFLTTPMLTSFFLGLSVGLIMGIIFMRSLQRNSMIPVLNGLASIIFLAVNIYSVVYSKDIPYVFNISLALVFGLTSGVDIVKYLPMLKLGNKE